MAFSISTFQLFYFPRYLGSQIYTREPYAPWTPPSGEIFLPKASTLQYLIVFLISTFYVQQFPRFQGVPKLRQVALCPHVRPLVEFFFCTPGEHVTMSNGVFNFNFLALLLFEILGGSKFTLGSLRPLVAPQRRNLCTQSEYFTISNCVFNFHILALVVSEILGGSKIYVRGPVPLRTPPSRKIFVPEASTLLCLMAFSISTFQLLYFPTYYGGPKSTLGGPTPPGRPLAEKFFYPK